MKITIYSTTICPACHTLTEWLDTRGQAYDKKVTDADPAVMAEFMAVNDGFIGVPFSLITGDDDTIVAKIVGFDKAKFSAALGI